MYALLTDDQQDFKSTVDDIAATVGVANPDDLPARQLGEEWRVLAKNGLLELRRRESGVPLASGVEVMVAAQALGERLVPQPFLPSGALTVELLELAGADPAVLDAVVDGSQTFALVLDARLHGLSYQSAEPGRVVMWGGTPETSRGLLLERTDDGARLCVATLEDDPHPSDSFALTQNLRQVTVGEVEPFGRSILDQAALSRWAALALSGICAESVGLMKSALDGAVEYSKLREAYGQPIGSFQAIQHIAADTHVSIEAAYGATCFAAWSVDAATPEEALHAARTAKAYTDSVARTAAENVMQIYGGVGQTWEHIAHFFARRVLINTNLLGNEDHQLELLARPFGKA